ncbi:MAG: biotin synthase BioB, partial [Bdellovibrionales bacterium]|nr:biotin synthase BioB [Bdellovibrionales bacterium]
DERLQTIKNVQAAGISVCTGGILGMGETENDRIEFIYQLTSFDPRPESITINSLVPFDGTPLEKKRPIDPFDVIRVIATLRIVSPQSMIRLSAGRLKMTAEAQFLCFYSGANSIFFGDKLLTAANPSLTQDKDLLEKIGYRLKDPSNVEH